jgi:capsule polysaccharide export protein KpsE/RkpR
MKVGCMLVVKVTDKIMSQGDVLTNHIDDKAKRSKISILGHRPIHVRF